MTTFLDDEIGRVPGESVIPVDWAPVQAANPAWTLTGDVWSTVTTEDVTTLAWVGDAALTPRMSYVLTIEALTDAPVSLHWTATVTYSDEGVLTVADGAANIDPTTPVDAGAWVETARAFDAPDGAVSGHFTTEVTAPIGTTIQLRAPFVAPLDGPLEIRAGAISADTISGGAFTGETFTGGEFVGGEFRTNDNLPGQVTLSDTAAQGRPGLSIEPDDSTGYDVLPSIGPDAADMHVRGGVATDGSLAGALFGPAGVSMYQNGPGENGTGAWVDVAGMQADLGVRPDRTDPMYESGIRAREQSVTAFSQSIGGLGSMYASPYGASINYTDPAEQMSTSTARVAADASSAELFFRPPGGAGGRLAVDAEGVWVERESAPHSQSWTRYNLEETATMPAPELLPYAVTAGWDTDHSPLGSVLVTHSTTGRHCQSRVRFNRRGADFPLTTSNTSIGQVIPAEARHTISMVDYIPITLPGGIAGELVADYRYGHIYLRTLAGTATMSDADYVYATLSWFLPN